MKTTQQLIFTVLIMINSFVFGQNNPQKSLDFFNKALKMFQRQQYLEADGSIGNVKVLQGIGGGCDDEAVRVIKLLPKWNPGLQYGVPVRVQFNMPIKFSL